MKAAHLLVLFLICMGVGDQYAILRLKRTQAPGARLRVYWLILCWLWLATMAAIWIMGGRALWYPHVDPGESKWVPGHLVTGVIAIISIIALLLPIIVAARKKSAAQKLGHAIDKLRFFLPATPVERFWWALLSITAGICEETLFRSFLLQYFRANPWRLGLGGAVALACVLFGLGHLYQGFAAAIGTGILAVLFFVLFLGSGSLLAPILLHALADLRVLPILRLAEANSV